jgi:hypothetical protein
MKPRPSNMLERNSPHRRSRYLPGAAHLTRLGAKRLCSRYFLPFICHSFAVASTQITNATHSLPPPPRGLRRHPLPNHKPHHELRRSLQIPHPPRHQIANPIVAIPAPPMDNLHYRRQPAARAALAERAAAGRSGSEALNGRQIKNVVGTAMALAIAVGRELEPRDIQTRLKAMVDFERDFAEAMQERCATDEGGDELLDGEYKGHLGTGNRHKRERLT